MNGWKKRIEQKRKFLVYSFSLIFSSVSDVFKRPHGEVVKEENVHHMQLQNDFAALVDCSLGTSKHLFENELK